MDAYNRTLIVMRIINNIVVNKKRKTAKKA